MRKSVALLAVLAVMACAPAGAAGSALSTKLEQLSAAGNGEAAYHLGMLYHLGLEGTPKDVRKAYDLFKLAAERGDPLGAYKLGCFYDGQGESVVESDAQLALRYKLVAARAGYSRAQSDVARHYFADGNAQEAVRWLEAAAVQGDAMALMALSGLYSGQADMPSIQADPGKSYAYAMVMFVDAPDDMAEMKRKVEAELKPKLTAEQLARANALIRSWRVVTTPITDKANSGLGAAKKLAS
jgi:TPR repeat protein